MGYEDQARSSAWTVIAIVLPLVFMVVGGLFILALAGWFYLRVGHAEQAATVATEQAVQPEQVARVMADEAAEAARAQAAQALKTVAEFEKAVFDKAVPGPQITIKLHKDGQLKLNGEAIELPRLLDSLKALAADETASITVDVRADEQCPFRHVADLISACQEAGITRFRFGTLDAAIAEEPSDEKEPATARIRDSSHPKASLGAQYSPVPLL